MKMKVTFIVLFSAMMSTACFAQEITQPDVPYTVVEQMPQFLKGGEAGFIKYLGKKIKYPEYARANNIEGMVYISFVIDKLGNVKDIKLLKGVEEHLDNEALRVIKEMPSWIPGMNDGVPVSVQYTVPIHFGLGEKK